MPCDLGVYLSCLAVYFKYALFKIHSECRNKGHHRQYHKPQLPVYHHHGYKAADDVHPTVHAVHHHPGDTLGNARRVVESPGNYSANRRLVIV